MAEEINILHDGWLAVDTNAGQIELTLIALPPTGASFGISAFKKARNSNDWQLADTGIIDTHISTKEGPQFIMSVAGKTDYFLRCLGEAHIAGFPGNFDIKVGITLHAGGKPISDFGGKREADNQQIVTLRSLIFIRVG